jgi:hypothetical protein
MAVRSASRTGGAMRPCSNTILIIYKNGVANGKLKTSRYTEIFKFRSSQKK